MIRLHALVEGQTEEAFFNRLLVKHLTAFGVFADVQLINPKAGSNARLTKGGWTSYQAAKKHLQRWMRQDQQPEARFTTMVDLYRIPKDFPNLPEASGIRDAYERVRFLEEAWQKDMEQEGHNRFIPYIQLHEFEALILADPQRLDWEFLEHEKERLNSR